jgi:protein O-GlcNAc transferase
VSWLGYVGTTGLSAMDYLIADRWEVPEGSKVYYRERVLRLPDGFLCYEAPPGLPEVEPLPGLRRRQVTFGSFNKPEKVNRAVVAVWADILHRAPQTRLLLKYLGFGDPGTCRHFEELFAARGIPRERLELQGHSPHAEHLRAYNQVDIALDPSPYSGGATTLEALWMGVPVITCPGETFAGRHSLSHLSNIGLTETIARDWSHYVELAVQLANDLPRLAKWRADLRPRMARSPLCDAPRFAANLMHTLRGVWRQWCEKSSFGP